MLLSLRDYMTNSLKLVSFNIAPIEIYPFVSALKQA